MPLPMRLSGERRFQIAKKALRATCSNTGSPVSRLSAANSSNRLPAPAEHVSDDSPGNTPRRKLIRAIGMPVGV